MSKFKPVESNPDFISNEKKLLNEWYTKGVVKKYLQKNKNSKKYYSFLDGPITANGPMGVHHAWGRTYKDIWQRYKNMQGFKQRFQNGFDCQGLWVEVEVEKELGLKTKKDIENLVSGDKKASIAKFVELCKARVLRFAKIQTEQSVRLGNFMDWDNSYYTMSDENNYMIWTFLKKCHEKGWVYKGHDSVPWCPRCGTSISQHEMLTEDYKEATHESVYIEYPINGRENEYLLVWTTTPWTLPANVAIAIDAEKDYAAVTGEIAGNTYYILKEAAERLKLKIVKTLKGEELVGLTYESPFDSLPRVKNSLGDDRHQVVASDQQIMPISAEEGTGLVHTAPGAGTEDFQLGKKLGLPVIEVIDEGANYLDGMEEFSGKNAKEHPELIIDFLKVKDKGKFLFDVFEYTHRYPACWRCHTELVWRVVDEWYIAMDPIREQMKKIVKEINWLPEFGLKRELDWLDNMHDWLISKKRYWGLALPIWVCESCNNFVIIGNKNELKEKTISGWDKFDGNTPHRPYIDEIKIKCECGGIMSRISDVGNPWLDAGIIPFSTISSDNQSDPSYLTDKKEWEKWFPGDFITESFPGQFKNWFYSLLAMSTVLENRAPFKNVLGYGTLLAEDGRAMHKSWGNAIEFSLGADKIGADIMRWMFAKQDPSSNMFFGYKTADETRRRFYLILWNCYKFFVDYANLSEWKCDSTPKDITSKLTIIDKWILSRLTQCVVSVNENLEKYDCQKASVAIEDFIVNDLSAWFLRLSRDRSGPVSKPKDAEIFLGVFYGVLVTTTKLLAPFTPFVSETIYRNLVSRDSVHLQSYPTGDISLIDEKLNSEMKLAREITSLAHSKRKEAGIPVRQPLPNLKVYLNRDKLSDEILELVKDELNIKNVVWEKLDVQEIKLELDIRLTEELIEEGKTRELVRKIQQERKKLQTPLNANIEVISDWIPESTSLQDMLKAKTLAINLIKGENLTVTVVD